MFKMRYDDTFVNVITYLIQQGLIQV